MTSSEAKNIIKNRTPDCSHEEIRKAWQYLVDTGEIWNMDKWFSDMASCMLHAGTLERNVA